MEVSDRRPGVSGHAILDTGAVFLDSWHRRGVSGFGARFRGPAAMPPRHRRSATGGVDDMPILRHGPTGVWMPVGREGTDHKRQRELRGMNERSFTLRELADYDGREGGEAFVAFEGKVYDVTDSPMWNDGEHEAEHLAGQDLTAAMADAPHGAESFAGFPVVGILAG